MYTYVEPYTDYPRRHYRDVPTGFQILVGGCARKPLAALSSHIDTRLIRSIEVYHSGRLPRESRRDG